MIGKTIGSSSPVTNKKKQTNQNIYQSYLNGGNLSDFDNMFLSNESKAVVGGAKNGYTNAKTPEGQSYFNNIANQERLKNGYYGGTDGSGFTPVLNLPEYKPYEYKPFEYDVNNDNIYKQYATQFARQGQAASEKALANTAAATGGMTSSYAAAANAQAQQAYAQKTADIIPVLEQNAYNRYLGEREFSYQDYLNQHNSQVNNVTAKYDSMVGLRDFNYENYLNNTNQLNWEKEFGLKEKQTDFDMDYKNKAFEWDKDTWNQEFSYEKYVKDRNYQLDRDKFNYGVTQDVLDREDKEKQRDYERNLTNMEMNYPNTVIGQLESRTQQALAAEKENNIKAAVSSALQSADPAAWLRENAPYLDDDEYTTVVKMLKDVGAISKKQGE